MNRPLRTAVVVSSQVDGSLASDAHLNVTDYHVVFVESTAHAYSQIRRVIPDVVLVCLELDDLAAFQVLSMMQADSSTSSIPVIMSLMDGRRSKSEDQFAEPDDTPSRSLAIPMMN